MKNEVTKQEFEALLRRGHEHARKHNLTEKDMREAMLRARSKNKNSL